MEHAEHTHHPNYVRIWAILSVLLVISVLGPMVGIRVVTLLTAFGIAIVKAYMVARYFMHIDIAAKYVTYLVMTVLVFMFLLFAGTAPDVMKAEGRNWTKPSWLDQTAHGTPAGGHGESH
ncbi:MAG: cytochrome C oxidase subunit IV family protein [Candidatus Rokuibacteriota bacterium]